MPKRKSKDSDSDDYILRKIKKLERKLVKRKRKRLSSASSEDSIAVVSLHEDNQPEESEERNGIIIDENLDVVLNTDEQSKNQDTLHNTEQNPIISNLPSTSTSEVPATSPVPLDDDILNMLGENPTKNKKYGTPIQAELAVRWEHIATTGLAKYLKKELLEKYHLPENCTKVGAPSLNPEVKAALSDSLVKKDKAIETKQNQQAIAISCISQALTKMFASESKDSEVIKLLIDGVRLLCDYQHTETMSRRSFVTSTIKKDIKDHLYATEIDNFLFGEKLAETLKSAKAINKSAADMKTATQQKHANFSQTKNQPRTLNGKPPLPLARQAGAGRRSAPATFQPRQYQAHPPPPPQPPARQQLPPPAPPQRSRARTQTRR